MRLRIRFRMRTLLLLIAAVAIAGGGARWWYDSHLAAHQRDAEIAALLETRNVSPEWAYDGPRRFGLAQVFADWPAFQRVTHLWCDGADLEWTARQMAELDRLESIFVLGRQVIDGAAVAGRSRPHPAVHMIREHPSLRMIAVDATIRATPHYYSPLYSRDDLLMLQGALPEIEIVWQEVN